MGLFSKPEYKETKMPIRYVEDEQELKDGLISLESYSSVEGITKYYYCLYGVKNPSLYDDGFFDAMVSKLRASEGHAVLVRLKYKNEKLKDFNLDLDDLAKEFGDVGFLQLDRLAWGINDTSSVKER